MSIQDFIARSRAVMAAVTKRPLELTGEGTCGGSLFIFVKDTKGIIGEVDNPYAQVIVHAVNNHETLLAMLEDAVGALENNCRCLPREGVRCSACTALERIEKLTTKGETK